MSSQKKKKASAKTRSRGISTGAASAVRQLGLPSAISTVRKNGTEMGISTIDHPTEGRGVRVTGSQQLVAIATAATTDLTFFTATTPATQVTTNIILLTPDHLNGRLAAFAGLYAKYVFRRVEFEFRPFVATTQAGGGVLAYSRDPQINVSAGTTTFSTAQEMETSVTFAFREPARLVMEYKGNSVYFTEVDATSVASYRQCCQGSIMGVPNAGSLGAVTQGYVHIHYIIDLFSPTPTQAIVGLSSVEREYLREELLKFRSRNRSLHEKKEEFELVRTPSRR